MAPLYLLVQFMSHAVTDFAGFLLFSVAYVTHHFFYGRQHLSIGCSSLTAPVTRDIIKQNWHDDNGTAICTCRLKCKIQIISRPAELKPPLKLLTGQTDDDGPLIREGSVETQRTHNDGLVHFLKRAVVPCQTLWKWQCDPMTD